MQKVCHHDVDVPTYQIRVHKTITISYYSDVFMVHYFLRNCVSNFHYCATQWGLSNSLSSNPNGDHMHKFYLREVVVPTYQLRVHKIISIFPSRVLFRVKHRWRCALGFFHYCRHLRYPSMLYWGTQMEIVCKIYTLGKLRYHLTTLGFTKMLEFYIIESCLG